jgi:hypothetical protein
MPPDDNLHDLLQIDLPGTDAFEEKDVWSRDADLLDHLWVASPCDASWDEMEGDELVRFCQHCHRNVYNVSGMSQRDAATFVREMEGKLGVRFFRRRDGMLLPYNCPVGLLQRWRACEMRFWLFCLGMLIGGLGNWATGSDSPAPLVLGALLSIGFGDVPLRRRGE